MKTKYFTANETRILSTHQSADAARRRAAENGTKAYRTLAACSYAIAVGTPFSHWLVGREVEAVSRPPFGSKSANEKLRVLMASAGLTVLDVAEIVGVDRSTVRRWTLARDAKSYRRCPSHVVKMLRMHSERKVVEQ